MKANSEAGFSLSACSLVHTAIKANSFVLSVNPKLLSWLERSGSPMLQLNLLLFVLLISDHLVNPLFLL